MKRRSFLSLLGLAPAAPLIARGMAAGTGELDPAVRIRMERGLPVTPTADETLQQPVSYAPQSQDWSECTLGVGDPFRRIECRDVTLSCSGAIAWPDVFSQQTGGKR
jgi:hypothetical protein